MDYCSGFKTSFSKTAYSALTSPPTLTSYSPISAVMLLMRLILCPANSPISNNYSVSTWKGSRTTRKGFDSLPKSSSSFISERFRKCACQVIHTSRSLRYSLKTRGTRKEREREREGSFTAVSGRGKNAPMCLKNEAKSLLNLQHCAHAERTGHCNNSPDMS